MEIIKNPWDTVFFDLVSNSKKSIKLSSPFFKENICDKIIKNKKEDCKIELVTSFKLSSLYSGSLDLNAVEKMLNVGSKVVNVSRLHAKIYLFDDSKVVVTSANLTSSGLERNFEYGVYSENSDFVSKVVFDYELLSNSENAGLIESKHTKEVKKLLEKLPKLPKVEMPSYNIESSNEIDDVIHISDDIFKSSMKGWKGDIFNCIKEIPKQVFTLSDVNEFEDKLSKIHPNNNRIKPKIRQQLQNLRDLGLIEFLGNGVYRKLWK